jgi:hypothetical protein
VKNISQNVELETALNLSQGFGFTDSRFLTSSVLKFEIMSSEFFIFMLNFEQRTLSEFFIEHNKERKTGSL